MFDIGKVDSTMVLWGQTLAYTFYSIAIILIVGWFGWRLTRDSTSKEVNHTLFYSFVGFLTILGMSLHLITAQTIPWVEMDLNRSEFTPDKVFDIAVGDHEFDLPANKLIIDCHDTVMFNVTSNDLTYGFGLFRQDNSMVLQMQVVPGHKNDILWQFNKPEVYSIRSTEYSGPKGFNMIEQDVVEVVGCQ